MRSNKISTLENRRMYKAIAFGVTALVLCVATGQSVADDTEIFFRTSEKPNVLFIMDVSRSMASDDDNNNKTRLDKLKTALKKLINTNDSFNAGLMSYSHKAIKLLADIEPVKNSKGKLISSINGLVADGGTPTQRALYEGMLYFRGEDAWTGAAQTYNSPIANQCQSNHIVLLSDGIPTYDYSGITKISEAVGKACTKTGVGQNQSNNGTCGAELTAYLRDTDHSSLINGFNNVITHTIGLNFDDKWLADIATGGSYTADSSDGLLEAFADIVAVAQTQGNSFAVPAVTVDQFSRLAHREDTYLALFQPGGNAQWAGNLKRYSFSGKPAALRDKNGDIALDSATGTFTESAHSFWSDFADGEVVADGGAANELDVATRNVYTYTGTSNLDLNHPSNAVHESNKERLASLIGQISIGHEKLLQWARGMDVDDVDKDEATNDTRFHMGDPLHSVPTVLNYGGTTENPESVVFVGTNEGYLHAIDISDGKELYSFIPPDLLSNLGAFYENKRTTQKIYGLDGDITLWVDDSNNDGAVDSPTEHAYLYVGMRRGGNNYYALDVTNKNNPKYLWSIDGGTGDFAELGQSWSKPTLTKVRMDNEVKDVLVFGGGYDAMQDFASIKSADTIGRSLFIVDAKDGTLLWSPTMDTQSDYSHMEYSMPSDPQLLDVNDDGLVDQIYIGDMGGQLWRFDLKNDSSSARNSVAGGMIASLSGSGIANNRRFFYPPDVVITSHEGKQYISVSIGSGNRAHPLDESVDNRFYMIRQPDIFNAPEGYGMKDKTAARTTYRAIEENDLYDATNNDINSSNSQVKLDAKETLNRNQGWILQLKESGEKVLSASLTLENTILFATYIPGQVDPSEPCAPATGGGRAYVVSLFDASPANGVSVSDRYQTLKQPGIAGGPTVTIGEDGNIEPRVGTESVDMPEISLTKRVYWSEQSEY